MDKYLINRKKHVRLDHCCGITYIYGVYYTDMAGRELLSHAYANYNKAKKYVDENNKNEHQYSELLRSKYFIMNIKVR